MVLAAVCPLIAHAQSQLPSSSTWRLLKHDCNLPSSAWSQRERPGDANQHRRIEQFDYFCGPGSQILVARSIEPCLLIPDLSIRVDVMAPLHGVQLLLHVVLPEAVSSNGAESVAVWIHGPATQSAGRWETLAVGEGSSCDLAKLLQQQTWGLKSQAGRNISLDRAYIDQIALNIYTQPGQNRVDVAEPVIQGAVSAQQFLTPPIIRDNQLRLAALTQDGLTDAVVQRKGSVIEVNGQPFFARIIQHNGEPFAYLRTLGFNTIQLPASATDVQLVEARQAGVWLICPPPPSLGIKPIAADFDRVLAWSLGDALAERELTGARQRAQEIRDFDSRRGRLIVAAVRAEWANYSGFCDALLTGQTTMGGTFPLASYAAWLHECSESFGHSIPLWVDVDTELSSRLIRQAAALGGQTPPTPILHQQALFATYEALSAGARGIRFKSRSRLDATDPATRLRALTLTWLNRKLGQVEPWAMGGARMGTLPLGDTGLSVTALKTNRAQLLIVQRKTGWEHRVAGDAPLHTIHVRDIYSGVADRAYLLAEHGLPLISSQFGGNGADIQIEHCPASAAVVLTQDPQVVASLSGNGSGSDQRPLVTLHAELVRQWLTVLQLVESQLVRYGRSSPSASGTLNEASAMLRKADEMLRSGSFATASLFIDQADQRLADTVREMLAIAYQPFRDHAAAPLLSHPCLLPAHWQLADRLAQNQWQANGLAGGDFENLQHMVDAGWQNVRTNESQYQTTVELTAPAAAQGSFGLRLAAVNLEAPRGLPQQPPLEIVSAPVAVPGGHMIRIHGYVNIQRQPAGAAGALVIADNLGGDDLALRVAVTEGWREFVIYRATTEPVTLRLNIQLNSPGEVWLDEITVRTTPIPLATASR